MELDVEIWKVSFVLEVRRGPSLVWRGRPALERNTWNGGEWDGSLTAEINSKMGFLRLLN